MIVLNQRADLVDLASQADEEIAADVRMSSDAGQRALQQHVVLAADARRAAEAVRDGDDPVHIGEVGQQLRREVVGDAANCMRRAVHRADHRDVVARADTAIRTRIAHEPSPPVLRHECNRPDVGAKGVVLLEHFMQRERVA